MKKLILIFIALFALTILPSSSFAAGGIYASGGGTKNTGETFTVAVAASGATFNALEGTISVSGPVSVVSFSAGSATWITSPANGAHFVGMLTSARSSLTVATIKLKATKVGSGAVTVSSVKLANSGSVTGTGAGSASFTIQQAPQPPGQIKVSSSSHPDPNTAYEATAIALSWEKPNGVDAFSYLLDQTANTTPPGKTTDASTSATYPDKAIGDHFFHIRAHNADGWGATTHFAIKIKEPDPKIDENLPKPKNIQITKNSKFVNDIKNGTVTGLEISGITEPNFTANITLTPAPTIPEGKSLKVVADNSGRWQLLIDYPIASGYHKLTVQGQKEKVLTPISDEITFEISHAKGGSINILTDKDTKPVVVKSRQSGEPTGSSQQIYIYALAGIIALVLIAFTLRLIKNKISR